MAVLYVVATPIGNLQDFSPRAVETLRNSDLIIAEDTRVTMKLCQVFDIHTRMISCHRHNELYKGEEIANQILSEDLTAVLTTDAGTPCISDPGYVTVRACAEKGICVIPVPGCCAAIAALSICGFDTREFAFYGFLPREKKDLREKLLSIADGVSVAVIHESPFRIIDLTEMISMVLPQAEMTVCCDLTKMHETVLRGSPDTVLQALQNNPKAEKGEYCIVLDLSRIPPKEKINDNDSISTEGQLTDLMTKGMSLREAQEELILRGEKKNTVKQAAIKLKIMFES